MTKNYGFFAPLPFHPLVDSLSGFFAPWLVRLLLISCISDDSL